MCRGGHFQWVYRQTSLDRCDTEENLEKKVLRELLICGCFLLMDIGGSDNPPGVSVTLNLKYLFYLTSREPEKT